MKWFRGVSRLPLYNKNHFIHYPIECLWLCVGVCCYEFQVVLISTTMLLADQLPSNQSCNDLLYESVHGDLTIETVRHGLLQPTLTSMCRAWLCVYEDACLWLVGLVSSTLWPGWSLWDPPCWHNYASHTVLTVTVALTVCVYVCVHMCVQG